MRTRALVIAPNNSSCNRMTHELGCSRDIQVIRSFSDYPGEEASARLMQSPAPEIVFLDCADFERALAVSSRMEECSRGIPIVAVNAPAGANNFLRMLRSGVREIIETSLTPEAISQALENLAHILEKRGAQEERLGSVFC